jgi:type I restriction enzyme S subunit
LLGSTAIVPKNGLYLHNQRLGLVQVRNPKELDRHFVYYLFNSEPVRQQIRSTSSGTKIRHTAPSRIYDVKVAIPLLAIQSQIAAILSAYDELIENSQKRIKILEAMARAIYREWFTYLRFPGHELASQIPSPLGKIPQGWEVRRVADFAEFTKGFEPGSAAYKKQSDVGLVRFLRVGDLSKRNSGLFVDADLAKGRVLQPLDIAITLDGSVGEVKLGLSGAYSSGIRRVDIKDPQRLGWAFAYQLLLSDSIQAVIHAHAKGTTIKHAGTAVAALVYVSPTKDVIENYERIAAPLMRQVLVLQEQVENLRRTRDLLLPRLLSGELDVEASAA